MTDSGSRLPWHEPRPGEPALNVYSQSEVGADATFVGNPSGLRQLRDAIDEVLGQGPNMLGAPTRFVNGNSAQPYLLIVQSTQFDAADPNWLEDPDPYEVPHLYGGPLGQKTRSLYKRTVMAERAAESLRGRVRELEDEPERREETA